MLPAARGRQRGYLHWHRCCHGPVFHEFGHRVLGLSWLAAAGGRIAHHMAQLVRKVVNNIADFGASKVVTWQIPPGLASVANAVHRAFCFCFCLSGTLLWWFLQV